MSTTPDTFRMHLALNVRDIERSVDFYAAFLGQAPARLHPDHAQFEPRDPGLILTLIAVPDAARGGALSHRGLRVGDDDQLHVERARIEAARIPIELEEDHVTCCYAVQNNFWQPGSEASRRISWPTSTADAVRVVPIAWGPTTAV